MQSTDLSHDSDSLTSKASVTHAQGVSSLDTGASQVLHVHLEDRGVSMEQWQEPWVPKHVLSLCQGNKFPEAARIVSPTGPKSEELGGGGDSELGTSQTRKIFLLRR